MTALTILMPMAGDGSRFRRVGELRPKPLVTVHGIPMFRLAAASLTAHFPAATVICIVQDRHDREYDLSRLLTEAIPSVRIARVPALTGGSLETCLAAEELAAGPGAPLVVLDCDLTFSSPGYLARLAAMGEARDTDSGLLLSFRSREPRYSYAALDGHRVTRTAEKDPISDRALIGAYGFGSAGTFFRLAHSIVRRNLRTGGGEYYVSSAFNALIGDGGVVRLEDASGYWSFGTPEELAASAADPALLAHIRALNLPVEAA
jgi:dTDP-glucose pyrophosphorylase